MTKKPKWDGEKGTLMIQSNPTSTGWVTHRLENNYVTEVLLGEWEFWAPCQVPQCGCLALGEEPPRAFGLEGQWDLTTETPLLECLNVLSEGAFKVLYTPGQGGKAVTS